MYQSVLVVLENDTERIIIFAFRWFPTLVKAIFFQILSDVTGLRPFLTPRSFPAETITRSKSFFCRFLVLVFHNDRVMVIYMLRNVYTLPQAGNTCT